MATVSDHLNELQAKSDEIDEVLEGRRVSTRSRRSRAERSGAEARREFPRRRCRRKCRQRLRPGRSESERETEERTWRFLLTRPSVALCYLSFLFGLLVCDLLFTAPRLAVLFRRCRPFLPRSLFFMIDNWSILPHHSPSLFVHETVRRPLPPLPRQLSHHPSRPHQPH